jgi:sugar lactone lactonase YvrE
MLEKRLEALTFAEDVPRITGLLIDDDDRLWAGVSVERPGETDRIDVYAPDGTLLGEIRAPEFFPDLLFGDGRVARLTADDLDVQQIVVYRLVEGPPAG